MSNDTQNDSSKVGKWYDTYASKQINVGVNLRHYTIMNEVIDFGLQKNSKILEIGCGVGTLSTLLASYVKRGSILIADISSKSVDEAKSRLSKFKNIDYLVSDMMEFSSTEKYDFVIFPDVLEHIPQEDHATIFRNIDKCTHENSKILIHIPHPRAIDFIRKNKPELLQIIDQAIPAKSLVTDASNNNFELIQYKSYPLFSSSNDYVFLKFRKSIQENFDELSKFRIIAKKLKMRIKFFIKKL